MMATCCMSASAQCLQPMGIIVPCDLSLVINILLTIVTCLQDLISEASVYCVRRPLVEFVRTALGKKAVKYAAPFAWNTLQELVRTDSI